MLNADNPLFLPPGSVRAILALTTIIGGGAFLIATGASEAIVGFVGLALGYYFAKRDAEAPSA